MSTGVPGSLSRSFVGGDGLRRISSIGGSADCRYRTTKKKGASNRVCLSKDACGSATITVTDADGHKYMLSVLSFMGLWGDWTPWIIEDDSCAGEYYASNITDYCSDKSIQYNAAFWGAQKYHDECPTSWTIYSENCSAKFHAFPGFWTISAAYIRERQWVCSQ